jgi:hypothetical protein
MASEHDTITPTVNNVQHVVSGQLRPAVLVLPCTHGEGHQAVQLRYCCRGLVQLGRVLQDALDELCAQAGLRQYACRPDRSQ